MSSYRMRTGKGTIYGMSAEEAEFETAEQFFLERAKREAMEQRPSDPCIRLGDVHLKALTYDRTLELAE